MSLNPNRLALSWTGWLAYAIVEVGLFVLANVTANSSSHPGTLSNVFFVTFIVGLALALLLGAATLIRQRSARR